MTPPPNTAMTQYVVYLRPKDLPHWKYVIRRWYIVDGQEEPVSDPEPWGMTSNDEDLGALRETLERAGLFRMPRWPADDPAILEVWI